MRYMYQQDTTNDLDTVLWTTVFTLIGGVIIFVMQRIVEQICFVPINKQKDTVEKIAVGLIQYAKYYANPKSHNTFSSDSTQRRDLEIAAETTREYSALLTVTTNNISGYKIWQKIGLIKITKEDALTAAGHIMALSNSYFSPDKGVHNTDLADKIKKLLHI